MDMRNEAALKRVYRYDENAASRGRRETRQHLVGDDNGRDCSLSRNEILQESSISVRRI